MENSMSELVSVLADKIGIGIESAKPLATKIVMEYSLSCKLEGIVRLGFAALIAIGISRAIPWISKQVKDEDFEENPLPTVVSVVTIMSSVIFLVFLKEGLMKLICSITPIYHLLLELK